MNGGIPALKRRMRLIDTGLAGQFLTKRAAFAGSVAVEEIPGFITLMRALSQTPETSPLRRNRPHARANNQRTCGTSAQCDPVLRLPGVHRPLDALPDHADAEQCQTGGDHSAPHTAFWTQSGLHDRLRWPLLNRGIVRQCRGKVLCLRTAERLRRFKRFAIRMLKRSGKIYAWF